MDYPYPTVSQAIEGAQTLSAEAIAGTLLTNKKVTAKCAYVVGGVAVNFVVGEPDAGQFGSTPGVELGEKIHDMNCKIHAALVEQGVEVVSPHTFCAGAGKDHPLLRQALAYFIQYILPLLIAV